ncbi:MAG: bifunctional homocysteine S-methyltransferase/methylenetetrahydrofolate reductase, partial [Desulfovibrionaceae bacterium]
MKALHERVLLADGAMGSQLFAHGQEDAACFDLLNLERPDEVVRVHEFYLEAGAEIIETNTFGANRIKLEGLEAGARVEEVNRRGAELARQCAGEERWVAGAMGPPGRFKDEPPDMDRIAAAYGEQALALAAGGADLLILETFPSLELLLAALGAVKAAVRLPVSAQLLFTNQGVTLDGRSARRCFASLIEAGADLVGLNCGVGPRGALEVLKGLGPVGVPLSVLPNAGYPERAGDRLLYSSAPEYFARLTAEIADHGARLVGGCCGAGPEHIRALRGALAGGGRPVRAVPAEPAAPEAAPGAPAAQSEFSRKLDSGKKIVLVELDPPKHLDPEPALAGAQELAQAGVDAITVAENPLASPRMSNIAMALHIRQRAGAETIIHLTGRDRNLIGLQSTIMGLASLGLLNVLAVTGDPPSKGAQERVTGVFDARSFELISILERMGRGETPSGEDLRTPVRFSIGAALNPNTRNFDLQLRRMERKIENGARYFLTQPVYSEDRLERIIQAGKRFGLPVFAGIMPLASHRNAEFLHNEFPGIEIPEDVRERMRAAGEAGAAEGVAIAWELLSRAWSEVDGVYIIPPF